MDTKDIVPDGVICDGHEYRLDTKCGFRKLHKNSEDEIDVYIPKCNKNIFIRSVDENWYFCPFCGGRLK